jgi:predicted nucleic acid-binding Zn ribbon protein
MPPHCSEECHHIVQKDATTLFRRMPPHCSEECHQIVQKDATTLFRRMPPNCSEGCHHIVQKDATKLFRRMPPNCSICKSAVQQQEIGVAEGRKPGGHGQDMGQRAIGRRNCIFALQKSKNCHMLITVILT